MTTNYHDLSATELAKLINDEYDVILTAERTNYPRAISIGEKLAYLQRGAKRSEWKTKLKTLCPHVSYETATKYIRVWKFQKLIEQAAERENVATTFLTIERALSLIATKREKKGNTDDGGNGGDGGDGGNGDDGRDGGGKPTPEAMVAKQTANAEEEAAKNDGDDEAAILEKWPAQRILQGLALEAGEMFEVLEHIYDQDELKDLTERLAKHLGMKLTPLSLTDKAIEARRAQPATNQPPSSTPEFERRI